MYRPPGVTYAELPNFIFVKPLIYILAPDKINQPINARRLQLTILVVIRRVSRTHCVVTEYIQGVGHRDWDKQGVEHTGKGTNRERHRRSGTYREWVT